eukprot:m.16929 g.16929  ORF g.16929 m.16929 type:complete len:614 (-) comp5113_c0_seq1:133-1974(-)
MAGAAVCSGGCTATGRLEDEYELAPAPGILNHATIQVLWISDTGQTSHSRKSKARSGGVTLGRGEDGDLACVAHYSDDETVFSLKGGVTLRGKFIAEGKATIQLIGQRVHILISQAEPHRLAEFMRLLCTKLAARKKEKQSQGATKENRVPYLQTKMKSKLYRPPDTVSEISPVSDRERSVCPSLKRHREPVAAAAAALSPGKKQRLLDELDPDQRAVFDAALSGQSVFFTGKAGTGKSYVLQKLLQVLPSAGTVVTASTGVAACNISGITLHSFAGFKAGSGKLPRQTSQWRNAQRLVIDEISMIDGAWFDELESVARRVRDSKKPFGGLQLIVCGDFFQLPPVAKNGEVKKYCFEARSWSKTLKTCIELQHVHRQSDMEFVDVLARIRTGKCTPTDVALLRSTERHNLGRDNGVEATRLCTHVADAEAINVKQLRALPGEVRRFKARDEYGSDSALLRVLNAACRAPETLELKVGAQVMLVKNLDVKRGLANGSRGVVVEITKSGYPLVRFQSGVQQTMHPETWVVPVGVGRSASRRQIPLQLAWGISVHKSQGMTLDSVELDLTRCFEYGQAYVALSRARSLEGLCVRRFSAACVRAHPAVLRFYEECAS